MIRAKFKVTSITRHEGYNGQKTEIRSVKLSPVTGGSDENKAFWAASPSGQIEIGCANLEAASKFELGGEYYVDFTPATAPSPAN